LTLGRKYNPKWYQWALSNHAERAVFFKGDTVFPREVTRYQFAANNLLGKKVLELGCSSGFGIQFFPKDIEYTGIDYDKHIIRAAKEQNWEYNCKFIHSDINEFELEQYDTIIAFETIEHIANGLEVVERLKKHCKRLIFTVPMNENPSQFSPHHLLHNLNETSFKDFTFKYIDMNGIIVDKPVTYHQPYEHNLLLGIWDRSDKDNSIDLSWLNEQDPLIYKEVITTNHYDLTTNELQGRSVIDIGANIGCLSLLAASMGAKMVIGVEPVNTTFIKFRSNVERSGFSNVLPMNFAVTSVDSEGKYLKISKGNQNSGANSLYNVNDDFELVPTISLETILKLCPGDDIFLKLDCEGAEYDIIMTATPESFNRIKTIVLEVHSDLHPVYKGREVLENKLKELGFRNIKIDPIYFFNYDLSGNMLSNEELPYCNQRWEK
jgi:FkbM family methyltransferase